MKVKSNLGVLNDDFYGSKIFSFLSYEKHILVKIYSSVNLMLFYYFRRGTSLIRYMFSDMNRDNRVCRKWVIGYTQNQTK